MDTKEYQGLLEHIGTLKRSLEKLGDRQEEWTDEDQLDWDKTDTELVAAEARLDDENKRRKAESVSHRLDEIKAPVRQTATYTAPAVLTNRTKVPAHMPLKAFRSADDAYDCGLWLKAALLNHTESREILSYRQPEWRAQTEGTDSAGGYTVPDPVAATVIQVLEETSAAMKLARVLPMSSDTMKVPRVVSGNAVKVPGEATAATASDLVFGQFSLVAATRIVLTLISNELMQDAVVNMGDIVINRAAHEIALNMDDMYLNADNGTDEGGIIGLIELIDDLTTPPLKVTAAGNTYAEVTLANFNTVKGTLPDKYHSNAKWVMSRSFYAQAVERLEYAAGGNTPGTIAGATTPTLFGHPIVFTEKMPAEANSACAALFGDFENTSVLGIRRDVEVATSADRYFELYATGIRTAMRWDVDFADYGTDSAVQGIVGLYLAAS